MRSSLASFADVPPTGNLAVPHVNFRGAPQPIPRVGITNIPAAGAISSTALDMAQWLRFVLAEGRRGTSQLIHAKTLGQILSPQTIVGAPDSLLARFVNFNLYGLGVEILDYKGHKLIEHGGRVDGMLSRFAVVPDQKLGVVVLTNTSGAAGLPPELPEALVYRVLDMYLGGLKPDWS
jgi:CubicO group peptidase (beta-lactamase class C family)